MAKGKGLKSHARKTRGGLHRTAPSRARRFPKRRS